MAAEHPPEAWVDIEPDPGAVRSGPGYNYGFVTAMGRLLSAHPGIGPHFGRLFMAVMFEEGALDRREREMVASVAAAAQDCHY